MKRLLAAGLLILVVAFLVALCVPLYPGPNVEETTVEETVVEETTVEETVVEETVVEEPETVFPTPAPDPAPVPDSPPEELCILPDTGGPRS